MLNEALFNQVADRLQQLAVAAEKSTHKPIQPYQLSELQKTMIARLLLRSYGFAIDLTVLFEALELIISYSNPEDSI